MPTFDPSSGELIDDDIAQHPWFYSKLLIFKKSLESAGVIKPNCFTALDSLDPASFVSLISDTPYKFHNYFLTITYTQNARRCTN